MTDDSDETTGDVTVELGDGPGVEGAPLARLSSRLTYGIEKRTIRRREGETEIRTPDGPRPLGEILDEVDEPYFDRRQEFETAVREIVGTGAIPTE